MSTAVVVQTSRGWTVYVGNRRITSETDLTKSAAIRMAEGYNDPEGTKRSDRRGRRNPSVSWPVVGAVALGAVVVGGLVWASQAKAAAPTLPPTPTTPPAPTPAAPAGPQILTIGPTFNPGQMTAHVGDSIHIIDAAPYSTTNPNGFVIYAAPTIGQMTDPTTLKTIGPGVVHIAWGAGTVLASDGTTVIPYTAGEAYVTVS